MNVKQAQSPRPSLVNQLLRQLRQNVNTKSHLLEAQLFMLALAIGIQDAISVPDFHCFASNQTGNTVLLAVGILQPASLGPSSTPPNNFLVETIMTSLGFFALGNLLSGQTANLLRATDRRWWLVTSSLVQTLLVFLAAGLQFGYLDAQADNTTLGRITLAILAFSSGMQVAMVRAMKISDITTAMATAAYVDVFIDPKLFASLSTNRGRNRRVAFLVSLIAGSFIGAAIAKVIGSAPAVAISGAIKLLVAVSFFCNEAEPGREHSLQGADSQKDSPVITSQV
ncbi:uncharacterized protein K489DRAFT_405536 [Dissoconium aciculare CBS 342.82]|uniref:DUF1275 domain protein n=1 Tax=Dissoconium aciculare CBS 342.82 TaxID=1314786 RepID=A0A6J3LPJ0_9PEZI|nr:uncharacterized protein K489DRAFT_405536 [Dissoconium aciculare CBS 342.82]KAF1817795.1 hypothetical protein K489DRAFT_405536 [Dissoconium aciculare CBS 342.82]